MKYKKNEKGFTLIDITVALIVVMLFMSLAAVLFFNLTKESKEIERESEATYIATNVIEAYKAKNYDDIELGEITISDGMEILEDQPISVPDGYTVTVNTALYNPEGENEDLVKSVVVKVKYKIGAQEKEVKLTATIVRV